MNKENNRINEKVIDLIIEEAMDKYVKDIASQEVECNMTDEQLRVMEAQKAEIYKRTMAQIRKESRPRRSIVKRCVILAAAIALVVALALSVSAVREFFFETYTHMSGTFLNISTGRIDEKCYDVIELFEYPGEIIIPGWLPEGMELTEIKDDYIYVNCYYNSPDLWVITKQSKMLDDKAVSSVETKRNVFGTEECNILGMKGQIVEMRSETGISRYTVTWNSDDVRYELSTNADRETLDSILLGLKYLH